MLMIASSPGRAAALPTPVWKLSALAAPTDFAPGETGTVKAGPLYLFEATNIGGASTSAPVSFEATIPAGVDPTNVAGAVDGPGSPSVGCSISKPMVTCTMAAPVRPGGSIEVVVILDTDPGLTAPAVAEATVSGGGAAPATSSVATPVTADPPSFGFLPGGQGLGAMLTEADGSPAGLAGSHPYQLTVDAGFPSKRVGQELLNSGHPRDLSIDLPRGLIVDPTATPQLCTEAELVAVACPAQSQVGIVTLTTSVLELGSDSRALYNMVPPPGAVSSFAFNAGDVGIPFHFLGSVRSGDFGLSAAAHDLLAKYPILALRLQLWGDPSSPSHDGARGGVSVPPQPRSLLTLPSACGPLSTTARVNSWEQPGLFVERGAQNVDLEGVPVAISGCGELPFSPSLEARPTTTVADSPSGLDVGLAIPQTDGTETRATANLRQFEATLPPGLVANPATAAGLTGCTSSEIGLDSPIGSAPARFDGEPPRCPDAARIGAATVETPLLDGPLQGSVYLATPNKNPFGTLLAAYVVVEDPASGMTLKLAGRIDADPATGRLSASFDELPQLPMGAIRLRIFGGARGPLRTPAICGVYSTSSILTPWSAPEAPPARAADGYAINRGPAGSACASSEGGLPSAFALEAGTVSPRAGEFTPFVFDLKRNDGTRQFSSVALTLPPGLVGSLAGIPFCPEVALGAAGARSATAEAAAPSCRAASRIGEAIVGAGAGPLPYYVDGSVYLAGPDDGAPLSLAIVVPALAGPFDLGTVTIRVAIRVDPETGRISAASGPIPQILDGIPLDLRSLRVIIDRPGSIRTPTSCDPASIDASVASPAAAGTHLFSPFQVAACRRLGFEPSVSVRLLGSAHRGAHPQLRTVLSARAGDANLRRFAVTLPRTELLDARRIGAVCAKAEFAADRCPAGSVQGEVSVWTPLLDRPLRGQVYLRGSGFRLPALVASLKGQVDLDLTGRLDSVDGRLRSTFRALPDVPVRRVVLTLRSARAGLLVNTGGLCTRERRAEVEFVAQNGKARDARPVVRTDCRRVGK